MDTSDFRRPSWIPGAGDGKCIARCWLSDPDAYVASYNARRSLIALAAAGVLDEAEALMDRLDAGSEPLTGITPEEVRRRLARYDTQESDT